MYYFVRNKTASLLKSPLYKLNYRYEIAWKVFVWVLIIVKLMCTSLYVIYSVYPNTPNINAVAHNVVQRSTCHFVVLHITNFSPFTRWIVSYFSLFDGKLEKSIYICNRNISWVASWIRDDSWQVKPAEISEERRKIVFLEHCSWKTIFLPFL